MTPLLGFLLGLAAIGLMVYLVREATVLKATAAALQAELALFKQGGFRAVVREELAALTQKAEEFQQRDRLAREEARAQLLEQQQRATRAAEQFHHALGTVAAQIQSLAELQERVGELNDLLKPQQLRGELGEVIVRTLIADKLPRGHYEEDYTFADGKKVEFVIRLNDKLIPVDSKLQMEDFRRLREANEQQRPALRAAFKRQVKQKIDEVKQYIRPQEGTMNFALMVVPSEAVFYELVASKDFTENGGLYEYAQMQHVFITSPLTFWAYLTTIAQGLKGLEIERRAEAVLSALQTLATDIRNFAQDEFRKVGVHLHNAASQYDEAERVLRNVQQGLSKLEHVEGEVISSQQGRMP